MKVLCIGRHRYLSDFLADFFRDASLHTTSAVGLAEGDRAVTGAVFDVVICDYDLLSVLEAEQWSRHRVLCGAPVVAVSLTRRAEDAPMHGGLAPALYLYLPLVEREKVSQVIAAVGRPVPYALPSFDQARERTRPSA